MLPGSVLELERVGDSSVTQDAAGSENAQPHAHGNMSSACNRNSWAHVMSLPTSVVAMS